MSSVLEFEEVQDILSDIPHINRGGCGIAALAMHEWLTESNVLYNPFIYLMYTNSEDMANNVQNFSERNLTGMTIPSHVAILKDNVITDCNGPVSLSRYIGFQQVDVETLKSLIRLPGWNYNFDRDRFIPILRRKLKLPIDFNYTNDEET